MISLPYHNIVDTHTLILYSQYLFLLYSIFNSILFSPGWLFLACLSVCLNRSLNFFFFLSSLIVKVSSLNFHTPIFYFFLHFPPASHKHHTYPWQLNCFVHLYFILWPHIYIHLYWALFPFHNTFFFRNRQPASFSHREEFSWHQLACLQWLALHSPFSS